MAFDLASYLDTAKTRIDQWVRDWNHADYNPTPLSVEQVKDLKIGSVCYIVSDHGTSLVMLAGYTEKRSPEWDKPLCGDAVLLFVGTGLDRRCKVKNVNKTYALLRTIP